MMYPFMTLNDNTEIVHSEMHPDGKVKVYIETPDEQYCFRHATCWLPDYKCFLCVGVVFATAFLFHFHCVLPPTLV